MMKGEAQKFSFLLDLSASNDLTGFKKAIEEEGHDIDEASSWYGRRMGSRKMGFEERTPLLIASMFGRKDVVNYIIETGRVDVNRVCGSDGATALHCVVSGGSFNSIEVVRTLLDAFADTNSVDANGNRPVDLIAPTCNSAFSSRKKILESLLNGSDSVGEIEGLPAEIEGCNSMSRVLNGTDKKEYSIDLALPDIKNEIYGTDEFRMYNFKVTPCSRAYSHDWTECPFVHPAENARRRDPRKYLYSCVPCPEFRKGSCKQGDNCEYAHGIFECWLHPAQYRTRLCKDGTNCNRKVCFFAHKVEELRPLYASTGSAVPSPRSYSATGSALEIGSMSPHALGSPSVMTPSSTSTPPLTPTGTSASMAGTMWPNQPNIVPSLQLHGSRLKSARCARNMDLNMEQLGLETHRQCQKQELIDEKLGLSSSTNWNSPLSTTPSFSTSSDQTGELNRFRGISLDTPPHQLQSPTGVQNINEQFRASYRTNLASSPMRESQSVEFDPSRPTTTTTLSPRPPAFANRSQSFIEHTLVNHHCSGFSSPASSVSTIPSNFSDWGSPDGKLDWGIHGGELSKLRKSSSLVFDLGNGEESMSPTCDEPDVSWVQSLVKDTASEHFSFDEQQQQQLHLNIGGSTMFPTWVEQMYIEQEQTVT